MRLRWRLVALSWLAVVRSTPATTVFPLDTNQSFDAVAAVQELAAMCQERQYARQWTNGAVFLSNVVARTSNTPAAEVIGDYTNWVYGTYWTSIVNTVTVENIVSALSSIDTFIAAQSYLHWSSVEDAEQAEDILARAVSTNHHWNGDDVSGVWCVGHTNYQTDLAEYWTVGPSFIDPYRNSAQWAYPLEQALAGGSLCYTSRIAIVTNTVAGWEIGDNTVLSAQKITEDRQQVPWYEPCLYPAGAFPTGGIPLVRFVYGPKAWRSSVAFYPTSVIVDVDSGKQGGGQYTFDSLVEYSEPFSEARLRPMYTCSTCGPYKVFLHGDTIFGPDPIYIWTITTAADAPLFSRSYDAVAEYASPGQLDSWSVPSTMGDHAALRCPPLSGDNWFAESCWVQQDMSAVADAQSYIPFERYATSQWTVTLGPSSTEILPFVATQVFYRTMSRPPDTGASEALPWEWPGRAQHTGQWAFASNGQGPALTDIVYNIVSRPTSFDYDTLGWTVALTDAAPRIEYVGDVTHWGDQICLVWTNRTPVYGRYTPGYVGAADPDSGLGWRAIYAEALNDRWRILRRLKYVFRDGGFISERGLDGATNQCCQPYGFEQPEMCEPGALAEAWNAVTPVFVDNGLTDQLRSDFQARTTVQALFDIDDLFGEDPLVIRVVREANIQLERGHPYADVPGAVTTRTTKFFTYVEDARSYTNCTLGVEPSCGQDVWSYGTGRKYTLFAQQGQSSGQVVDEQIIDTGGEITTTRTWGVASSLTTAQNASKPVGVAACLDEFDTWWEYELDVDYYQLDSGTCDLDFPVVLYSGGGGYGGYSGSTRTKSLVEFLFQHGD